MKERYGKEFRRNIRFEDAEHTLCIDIKLPGQNTKWISVSYGHALADRRAWSQEVMRKNIQKLSSRPAESVLPLEADNVFQALASSRNPLTPSRLLLGSSSSMSSSASAPSGQSTANNKEQDAEVWGRQK